MNIFITSPSPIQSAREHCNIHVRKMIVENLQMLSTAHHMLDGSDAIPNIYKKTHFNHPSAIWTRSSTYAYKFVWLMCKELCKMYTESTGKVHKSESVLNTLATLPKNLPEANEDSPEWPKPAMPDEYLVWHNMRIDVCLSYQNYLNAKFIEWLTRAKPLDVHFQQTPAWLSNDVIEMQKNLDKMLDAA